MQSANQRPSIADPPGGADVLADDRLQAAVAGFDRVDALLQEERDPRLGLDHGQLAVIGIGRRRFRVAARAAFFGHEFGHHVADVRIGGLVDPTLRPDADLRAAVAAQDGPVLNEGHREPQPGGGNGRRRARDPSAHHDQVETTAGRWLVGQAQQLAAELG